MKASLLAAAASASLATAVTHTVPFKNGASAGALTVEVASVSSFRLGVRMGTSYNSSAISTPSLDSTRQIPDGTPVSWGGKSGLQTSFGALLAGSDGSWALYDQNNNTVLYSNNAPYANNGSDTRDAGIVLPINATGGGEIGGGGKPCLGNGLFGPPFYYNRQGGYMAFAVSGWFYDPVQPHCYPVSFNGQIGSNQKPHAQSADAVAAIGSAVGDFTCPVPTQNGTDAAGSVRSDKWPNGLSGTTQAQCCAACSSDPSCIAYIWSDGTNPDPNGNCWPLKSFTNTIPNQGRVFGGQPPPPPQQAYWAMGDAADWYLAITPTPMTFMKSFYQLTGAPAVPPRYAMGFMATYWGYDYMEEVEGNMTAFRDGQYPIDSFIMDYDWWNTAENPNLDFGYDQKMFGNHSFIHPPNSTIPNATTSGPVELFNHFHKDINMRFGGIRKPRTYSNIPFSNSSGWLLPDSFSVGAGDNNWNMTAEGWADWYTSNHLHFLNDGLDYWWNDEGETQWFTYTWWNAAQWQEYNQTKPGERFWTINRSFQPGMQRYPAISWTGDRQDCSHPTVLTFTVAGQPYTACDMTAPDATVLVRQYWNAVFLPIMRVHAMHGTPRFPYLWGGAEHQAAFRAALNTRYTFLPHLYSLAHASHRDLLPIVQPASYIFTEQDYPNFPASIGDNTYMVSSTLLPADVSTSNGPDPNENTTHVNIPPGVWYAYNSTATLTGPITDLTYTDVPLDQLVLFVRAGAILTLQRDIVQYTDAIGGVLRVQVYAGADGAFDMVEDDGASVAYLSNPTSTTKTTTWTWDDASNLLSWSSVGSYSGPNSYTSVEAMLFVSNSTSGPVFKAAVPLTATGSFQF